MTPLASDPNVVNDRERGPHGLPSSTPRLQRFLFRRLFYLQLPKIVARRLWATDKAQRIFVSLMGGSATW